MRRFAPRPAGLVLISVALSSQTALAETQTSQLRGDPAYGAYLSGECTTCHHREGRDAGIPSIVNWPEADFVAAMQAYKARRRDHPVMQMIAGRLSDAEIAALAAYFNTLDP
ncbi:c-type cytochrome [uncultured Roseobacter sp.]|uniref:c-type cytochrome n=1 Tax=uncultured Roseobacter sp. TaxID=114847 RepID=UPI0034578DC3